MSARTRTRILAVVLMAAGGCSESNRPSGPSTAPAETSQALSPADLSDTGPPAQEPRVSVTPPPLVDEHQRPALPAPTDLAPTTAPESPTADSQQPPGRFEDMLGSVGRVLFGAQEGEQAVRGEPSGEDDGSRSILGSVGRALSKAAVETARSAPPGERE